MSIVTAKLGDVAHIDRSSVTPDRIETGISYLGLEHIQSGGAILKVQSVESGELKSSKFRFTSRHILYGKLRPYLAKISAPDFDGVCSTDIIPILPGPNVERKYLLHFLRQGSMVDFANSRASGANLPRISPKELAKFQVPLPSVDEQKRIASILDAADALRAKRREAIAQLDALLKSTFMDIFGDPVDNPNGWNKCLIEDVFDVARGGSPRPIEAYLTKSQDGVNWIMIGDAEEGARYISSTKKKIIKEGVKKSRIVSCGDFLLTNSMSFGKPYILRTDGCIHDGWLVLSPKSDQVTSNYFYNFLSTDALYRELSKRAAGAVVKNLNTKIVKQVSVTVPPLEIQHRFDTIVESVEEQKARMQAHLTELDALFASLQHRAFTGEL